jgi:RimJ/RimL family protein N-acetyltransferase
MGAAYAHREFGVDQIWAMTPWAHAGVLIQAVGFERVAVLPGYAMIDGSLKDVVIYKKVRMAHG